eukprot:TRINITY_DN324_c0_g2_i1.p1 TRINITY_DN324_c0_g2~~TRINITY_DN324_c0_g2_i1.p1  ORF type:complete len:734 (+),score=186.14 TRINITY_DN324_c0_g2_i1:235-2202(+)
MTDWDSHSLQTKSLKSLCIRMGEVYPDGVFEEYDLQYFEVPNIQWGRLEDGSFKLITECEPIVFEHFGVKSKCYNESDNYEECVFESSVLTELSSKIGCQGYGAGISHQKEIQMDESKLPSLTIVNSSIPSHDKDFEVSIVKGCEAGILSISGENEFLTLAVDEDILLLKKDLSTDITEINILLRCEFIDKDNVDDIIFAEERFDFSLMFIPEVITIDELSILETASVNSEISGLIIIKDTDVNDELSCTIAHDNSSNYTDFNASFKTKITQSTEDSSLFLVNLILGSKGFSFTAPVVTDGFDLDMSCEDSFGLKVEMDLNVKLIDGIEPEVVFDITPPSVVNDNQATFEVHVSDGGIPCSSCTVTAFLDGIEQLRTLTADTNVYKYDTDVESNHGMHRFVVQAIDNAGFMGETSWEWNFASVYLISWIMNDDLTSRKLEPQSEQITINEFGEMHFSNSDFTLPLSDAGVKSESYVTFGFTLSSPALSSKGEIVTVSCEVEPKGAAILDNTSQRVYTVSDVTWFTVYGTSDSIQNDELSLFTVTCSSSANIPNNFNDAPDIIIYGQKENTIWPRFYDAIILTEDGREVSSITADDAFAFTSAGNETIKITSNEEIAFIPGLSVTLYGIKENNSKIVEVPFSLTIDELSPNMMRLF